MKKSDRIYAISFQNNKNFSPEILCYIRYLQRIKDICENGEICHPNLITYLSQHQYRIIIIGYCIIPIMVRGIC